MQQTRDAYELLFDRMVSHGPVRAVLRAAFHPSLLSSTRRRAISGLVCQQTSKPEVVCLTEAGFQVISALEGGAAFDVVGIVPTRQKQETLGMIARAMGSLKTNGTLIVSCPNDLGARGYERALREVFSQLTSESRKHCRVLEIPPTAQRNETVLKAWSNALNPAPQPESGLVTAPGMFSWEHPDPASVLLVSLLPLLLAGCGADLGAGYGFLSRRLLELSPDVARLILVEAEALALDCARKNLAGFGGVPDFRWEDVTQWETEEKVDWVVMNPPFHSGSAVTAGLGVQFVRKAADILRPGGMLYMVANVFLPYERELGTLFDHVEKITEAGGYKVLFAAKPK